MTTFSKFASFLFLLSLISVSAFAAPKAYMEPRKGFFSGRPAVVVNGKKLSAGFFASGRYKVADEMKDNPEAYQFALKHESLSKWSGGLAWGGVAAALTYALVTSRDDYREGAYWAIFGVPFIGSLFLQQSAQNNLMKAINSYNGVSPVAFSAPKFFVRPVKSGAVAMMGLEF